jgi:pyruvate-formate lyase-activating enzyme
MIKTSRYFKSLSNDRVEVLTSPEEKIVEEGEIDRSGVKQNINGKLKQLNYGKLVTLKVRKLSEFLVEHEDSERNCLQITLLGNNLRLTYDPDWSTSQFSVWNRKEWGRERTNELVARIGYELSTEEIVSLCKDYKVEYVLFSGSEPSVNLDYIEDLSTSLQRENIKNIWHTHGYFSELVRDYINEYVDGILIDLYSADRSYYRKHLKGELRYVTENIIELSKTKKNLEIRTYIVPSENDTEHDIREIKRVFNSCANNPLWQITQFRPSYKVLDKKRTTIAKLRDIKEHADDYGIRNRIVTYK